MGRGGCGAGRPTMIGGTGRGCGGATANCLWTLASSWARRVKRLIVASVPAAGRAAPVRMVRALWVSPIVSVNTRGLASCGLPNCLGSGPGFVVSITSLASWVSCVADSLPFCFTGCSFRLKNERRSQCPSRCTVVSQPVNPAKPPWASRRETTAGNASAEGMAGPAARPSLVTTTLMRTVLAAGRCSNTRLYSNIIVPFPRVLALKIASD